MSGTLTLFTVGRLLVSDLPRAGFRFRSVGGNPPLLDPCSPNKVPGVIVKPVS